MDRNQILCRADMLNSLLDDPNTRIVDGSWHLPNANRDALAEYQKEHIPGAVFFDIDAASDPNSGLPRTMPDAATFSAYAGGLGISDNHQIIVYDTAGLFSAARVWWMFRQFGATNVRVLDGGLPAWKNAGLPTTFDVQKIASVEFNASAPRDFVGLSAMRSHVDLGEVQILDARGAGRFSGKEAEPRPGMRAGHMPNATNVPFTALLNDDGTVKSTDNLKALFAEKQVDETAPIVTSCGSGVTAAIIVLALELIGYRNAQLYDGSWSEWGSLKDTPIEVD